MIDQVNHVVSVAGSVIAGYVDGRGTEAKFERPFSGCFDPLTGSLFVVDTLNHKIRRINSQNVVSTFAGSVEGYADGDKDKAMFFKPCGVCLDVHRRRLFIADTYNHKIRVVDMEGNVSTLAGSTWGHIDKKGTEAKLYYPSGIVFDELNDLVYFCDYSSHTIRSVDMEGNVKTLAGCSLSKGDVDGFKAEAMLFNPYGICMDNMARVLYITDYGNHKIKMVDLLGNVTTLAGSDKGFVNGFGSKSKFNFPHDICTDGNNLYVCDTENHRIRKIKKTGEVSVLSGSVSGYNDGNIYDSLYKRPFGICYESYSNSLIVIDTYNHLIRKIQLKKKYDNFMIKLYDTIEDEYCDFKIGDIDIHYFVVQSRLNGSFERLETLNQNISSWNARALVRYIYLDDLKYDIPFEELMDILLMAHDLQISHFINIICTRIHSLLDISNLFGYCCFLLKNGLSYNIKLAVELFESNIDLYRFEEISMFDKVLSWVIEYDTSGSYEPHFTPSNMENDKQLILEKMMFTDTNLNVIDIWGVSRVYPCHKAILATRSDYFKNIHFKYDVDSHKTPLCQSSFDILFKQWYNKPIDLDKLEINDILFLSLWGDMYLSEEDEFLVVCREYFSMYINEKDGTYNTLSFIDEEFPTEMIEPLLHLEIMSPLFPKLSKLLSQRTLKSELLETTKQSLETLSLKTDTIETRLSTLESRTDIIDEKLSLILSLLQNANQFQNTH